MSTPTPPSPASLRERLPALTIADEHRLRRALDDAVRPARRGAQARRGGQDRSGPAGLERLAARIATAELRSEERRAVPYRLDYPEQLPVSQRHDDLLAAIRDHQVVVVAGETGSGKTTQLPKLCLELGLGVRGMIGHTQPRRIAARSVAERIADELQTPLGEAVGYSVRFTDQVSDRTLVKVMTDGILLAEIQRDRMLRRYQAIIIDEAHERSLNIDFLLGYLHQLLPRRPDLKLIVTSATIDPERFARYFDGAPVIEVSGRSYPVEIRYRPISDPDAPETEDRDQVTAICDAVRELGREAFGDTLVFLSGEREIRDTAEALDAMKLADTEILPLYGRLSTAEQHRVFAQHAHRRIVLATNVAETSLTVPGIRYVIDAGTARISRYSNRTKVQLLPIEPISQASARQRSGRCGRTSDGICIRLYSEDDYESRPAFTDPEILRTNLASVILQMASLDLGAVEAFGFIDAPDRRQIADGVALLQELGALRDSNGAQPDSTHSRPGTPQLTDIGRRLAQLPVDPRLARMIVEADQRGCVRDVLVLAAALSIQDPRERPLDHQQAADAAHARFADPRSDFTGYLALWRHIREQQRELSGNQFRRMCRAEFLSYLRIREWQDLFAQLRQIAKSLGITIGDADGDLEQVHRSLLSGLLSHVGTKEGPRNEYLGARNAKFAIFPGSALAKRQPQFVMAAELVETSRLWGRVAAAIEPSWAEELAGHLVRRTFSEPHWERKRAAVIAYERVTLYGVPLVAARKAGYHSVDAVASRELFIRHALVERDWDTRHSFFERNAKLIDDVRELEERSRRRDLLVDDETLFAFYDQRIPASVVSGRHFDSWWKKTRHRRPDLLDLSEADLVREGAGDLDARQFPDRWTSGSFEVNLEYHFEPGSNEDGVTVTIPLPLLPEATRAGLDWQVPGLRTELVTALLRSLPKPLRRLLVPVPDTAAQVVAALPDELAGSHSTLGPESSGALSMTEAVGAQVRLLRGVEIPADAWDLDSLPGHLRPLIRVVDVDGATLAEGKDLAALQRRFAPQVAQTLRIATDDIARDEVRDWDFDVLPRTVQRTVAGHEMTGFPALVDVAAEPGTAQVAIRVLESAAAQRVAMWAGLRRLLVLTVPSPAKQLRNTLTQTDRLLLSRSPHGALDALLADCVGAAVDLLMQQAGAPVWTQSEFRELQAAVAARLGETSARIVTTVAAIIGQAQQAELALDAPLPRSADAMLADERKHLRELVYPGFVTSTDPAHLLHLPRYLQAIGQRVADAPANPARDAERQAVIELVTRDLEEVRVRVGPDFTPELSAIRWMIEELRVSLFAQRLGTAYAISVKRIHAAMDAVDPR